MRYVVQKYLLCQKVAFNFKEKTKAVSTDRYATLFLKAACVKSFASPLSLVVLIIVEYEKKLIKIKIK